MLSEIHLLHRHALQRAGAARAGPSPRPATPSRWRIRSVSLGAPSVRSRSCAGSWPAEPAGRRRIGGRATGARGRDGAGGVAALSDLARASGLLESAHRAALAGRTGGRALRRPSSRPDDRWRPVEVDQTRRAPVARSCLVPAAVSHAIHPDRTRPAWSRTGRGRSMAAYLASTACVEVGCRTCDAFTSPRGVAPSRVRPGNGQPPDLRRARGHAVGAEVAPEPAWVLIHGGFTPIGRHGASGEQDGLCSCARLVSL